MTDTDPALRALREAVVESRKEWESARRGTAYRTLERGVREYIAAAEAAPLDVALIEGAVSTALYEYDVDAKAAQHVMDELRAALAATNREHRAETLDGVPTGFCECGQPYPHAATSREQT